MTTKTKLTRFNDNVLVKYHVYNSIFTSLPFDKIKQTGVLLPLFEDICETGFEQGKNPTEIIHFFYDKYLSDYSDSERLSLLFKFVQYIERQVVLFDAIEESAFSVINNLDGIGTLRNNKEIAFSEGRIEELKAHFKKTKVRVVLTAHPTQFYPGDVLGIITDLGNSIADNNMVMSKKILAQLGKTPFFKHEKPSPLDEAVSLIWYLENILYHSISDIYKYVSESIFERENIDNSFLEIGFWPGGDRDGNPFVTTEITLEVAQKLRHALLKNYHSDIKKLRRRLTFKDVVNKIIIIERALNNAVMNPVNQLDVSPESLLKTLIQVKGLVASKHQSLFIEEIDDLIHKIQLFGFHFATLDIRQDSSIHDRVFDNILQNYPDLAAKNYVDFSDKEKCQYLSTINESIAFKKFEDEEVIKTLAAMQTIKTIQKNNGEKACNRYIISNTQSVLHIMQTYTMLKLSGFNKEMPVDVVPLFETVPDLKNAGTIMEELFSNQDYRAHIEKRGNKQPIMLGFSDGTKDGGYLMANWGIYQAKENLTSVARQHGIQVVFFDGRGGPPARGGGKTHKFYASLGPDIAHKEIQLTVQGQTISTHYGSLPTAQYNLEQLLGASISNSFSDKDKHKLSATNRKLINELSQLSYDAYLGLKEHAMFVPYLEKMSTLKYYGKTNIGSRPSKRNQNKEFVFSDLRAIPFVGSWSMLKQNVPGFYGVGFALEKFEKEGRFNELEQLYSESDFIQALFENSMMSLTKSFFKLTEYMKDDKEFGEFWKLLFAEYQRSKRLLLKLSGQEELMENYPSSKASIKTRENIVLPLLTIQQYALQQIQALQNSDNNELKEIYEKLVVRSLYGNINASRNSA